MTAIRSLLPCMKAVDVSGWTKRVWRTVYYQQQQQQHQQQVALFAWPLIYILLQKHET